MTLRNSTFSTFPSRRCKLNLTSIPQTTRIAQHFSVPTEINSRIFIKKIASILAKFEFGNHGQAPNSKEIATLAKLETKVRENSPNPLTNKREITR